MNPLSIIDVVKKKTLEEGLRPLEMHEIEALVSMSIDDRAPVPFDLVNKPWRIKECETFFPLQVMVKRLEVYSKGIQVTEPLLIFLACLCLTPAHAVMWAYTITRMWRENNRLMSINEWTSAFPTGVPTEATYKEVWGAQKGIQGVDNFLDTEEPWL